MRILLIQTAFIGDVILATSLLEKLHHEVPQAKIDFLLRKGNESLLEGHPFVNEVLIWDKKKGKYKALFHIWQGIRQEAYEVVINVQRFFSTGFITSFSKATKTIGFDKNPLASFFSDKVAHQIPSIGAGTYDPQATGTYTHEIERNCGLAARLTQSDRVFLPRLYPSETDYHQVQQTNPYFCIAPTSVWGTKQLPAEKWLHLISQLPSDHLIFLLGAPSDVDACAAIQKSSVHPQIYNQAGKLSLLQSAALMRGAVMNYVNDSAPLHLASAMNAPVTAFFCSTVPAFGFTPLSEKSTIVEVATPLPCRPCGLHGHKECPRGHFRCAKEIIISA